MDEKNDPKTCRCPVRPYFNPGSFGSGSATEDLALARWQEEHGGHPYAKARDTLAKTITHALAAAERETSGADVRDMVADIFDFKRTK